MQNMQKGKQNASIGLNLFKYKARFVAKQIQSFEFLKLVKSLKMSQLKRLNKAIGLELDKNLSVEQAKQKLLNLAIASCDQQICDQSNLKFKENKTFLKYILQKIYKITRHIPIQNLLNNYFLTNQKIIDKMISNQASQTHQENALRVNQFFKNIKDQQILQTECIGCISFFSSNIACQLVEFRQNYIIQSPRVFYNQQVMTENICALLNCQGGYLLVFDEKFCQSGAYPEGISLSNSQKQDYKIFIHKCVKYIEPSLDTISYCVDFVPVFDSKTYKSSRTSKYVIRIQVKPLKSKFLYYIGYRLESSQKKMQAQFFSLDGNGEVYVMNFDQVYEKIHSFFSTSSYNEYKSAHQGIQCRKPKSEFNQSIIHQDSTNTLQTSNNNIKQINKQTAKTVKKLKYSTLILKAKEAKNDEKRAEQFTKALINEKILFNLENISLPDCKMTIWLLSYDCYGEVIENVLKVFNRGGDLTICRTFRSIRISDERFYNDTNKIKQVLGEVEGYKLSQGINSEIKYKIVATYARSNQVVVQFKQIGDAILCFGFLYKDCRRVQFAEIKN